MDFASPAPQGTLVVSSQLRSPVSAGGFTGMFVPGLAPTDAAPVTVLTSLVNGDGRTNIGVYNPNNNPVTATIRLFDGPVFLGSTSAGLAGHGVTQINNIYNVVGFGSLVRTNGYATVESSDPASPLFSFAAEADNKSGDLILIVGSKDIAAPAGFNPPTATVAPPTTTPTPAPPTVTPTPTATTAATIVVDLTATQFQWTFSGADGASGSTLTAKVGQTYELHIRDGDRSGTDAHGFSGIPSLGVSAFSPLTAGSSTPRIATFKPTSSQLGSHFFSCDQSSCGSGHDNMLGTIRVVN